MRQTDNISVFEKYHWILPLLIVTAVAILLRLLPGLLNAAWGNDFGIYYGLTNSFVETKSFINPYNGWGSSYQYFPVLYAITGFAHFLTGIETIHLLSKIAPIFGGLTIPILYFIVYELFKNRNTALISSVLLSTATFHVYQTSHAAPLTIGHFFMMISIFFFIKYIKKSTYLIPLFISTAFLIMSHHFTMYFYIISISFMLFAYTFYHSSTWKKSYAVLSYVLLASTSAFAYWMFVATPVYDNFMNGKLLVSSPFVILVYFLAMITGFFICRYSHRFKDYIPSLHYEFRPCLSFPKKVVFIFTIILFAALIAIKTGIPGVHISLNMIAVIYSIPMILLASFSLAGLSLLKQRKNNSNYLVQGWIFALIGSFLFSILSATLMPDRHLEYLIVPLCIPAALSINYLIKNYAISEVTSLIYRKRSAHLPHSLKDHMRTIAIPVIVGSLVIANTMAAYPTIDVLDSLDERVSDPCISVLDWMEGNVSNESVIASDHRLSMLCWANGYNITYGQTNVTWHSGNFSECFAELIKLNVTHILIDDIMRTNVVNIDVGRYYYMTNASYDKFSEKPFRLIYRNATVNDELEEIHWVELYEINYSKILTNPILYCEQLWNGLYYEG
ncbi:MAG: hypothetical protein KGY50_00765 [Candidatus Thermoplasmatota archaeon]|nr:hypothetical protein [Candidatus Thermoplasmatota archaeon]